ncbi:hypothetical protein CCYS_02575 [Corynebacterium cystitidis DSM 20524]|nr:hypothetical protein CCYS_02575 [Corynebacterium cystitidis DSM 20524]SNV87010.1 Uncharacterised protein [Corynebacterium cystitidis]
MVVVLTKVTYPAHEYIPDSTIVVLDSQRPKN